MFVANRGYARVSLSGPWHMHKTCFSLLCDADGTLLKALTSEYSSLSEAEYCSQNPPGLQNLYKILEAFSSAFHVTF